jgi:hypothetical protein
MSEPNGERGGGVDQEGSTPQRRRLPARAEPPADRATPTQNAVTWRGTAQHLPPPLCGGSSCGGGGGGGCCCHHRQNWAGPIRWALAGCSSSSRSACRRPMSARRAPAKIGYQGVGSRGAATARHSMGGPPSHSRDPGAGAGRQPPCRAAPAGACCQRLPQRCVHSKLTPPWPVRTSIPCSLVPTTVPAASVAAPATAEAITSAPGSSASAAQIRTYLGSAPLPSSHPARAPCVSPWHRGNINARGGRAWAVHGLTMCHWPGVESPHRRLELRRRPRPVQPRVTLEHLLGVGHARLRLRRGRRQPPALLLQLSQRAHKRLRPELGQRLRDAAQRVVRPCHSVPPLSFWPRAGLT